jgi:hypothetical protein
MADNTQSVLDWLLRGLPAYEGAKLGHMFFSQPLQRAGAQEAGAHMPPYAPNPADLVGASTNDALTHAASFSGERVGPNARDPRGALMQLLQNMQGPSSAY